MIPLRDSQQQELCFAKILAQNLLAKNCRKKQSKCPSGALRRFSALSPFAKVIIFLFGVKLFFNVK